MTVKDTTMVIRDLAGIIVGLGGIVYHLVTVPPDLQNEMTLLILALVAGVPGASQLLTIVSNARNGSPTDSSSLPSQPGAPLPDSPSSSPSV